MQTSVNTIVKNLFHRNSLQEVSEDQLQEYVKLFPYSSVGHLLLAKKKKESGSDYKQEAAIASLYVNNPLWLHCFMHEDSFSMEKDEVLTQQPLFSTQPEIISAETINEQLPVENIVEQELVNIPAETIEENIPDPIPATAITNETTEEARVHEVIADEIPVHANNGTSHEVELANNLNAEKVHIEEEPVFEPYHTIDYFASQGIKLRIEDLANDKFGRQLKSFTDWLRSMKRIGPVKADDLPENTPNDAIIQKDAEESVETSEVDTEAMAEVWIKQGKTARAIAIYHKLSLLNPSKSHYFAAKIEQLNA